MNWSLPELARSNIKTRKKFSGSVLERDRTGTYVAGFLTKND